MVHSPDENTNFFDIVAGVLQWDTLAPYLFIICLDYILWALIDLMKGNGFILKKARSRWYPAETIIDTDYKSWLHRLELAAGGTGFHIKANKTEYICFKQEGAISTLSGEHLKLLDKFVYLSSNVSSTESDVNICLAKVWTAINRLMIIGSLIYLIR